jgi:hypothetical protein
MVFIARMPMYCWTALRDDTDSLLARRMFLRASALDRRRAEAPSGAMRPAAGERGHGDDAIVADLLAARLGRDARDGAEDAADHQGNRWRAVVGEHQHVERVAVRCLRPGIDEDGPPAARAIRWPPLVYEPRAVGPIPAITSATS